jgi:hypothetical protein
VSVLVALTLIAPRFGTVGAGQRDRIDYRAVAEGPHNRRV